MSHHSVGNAFSNCIISGYWDNKDPCALIHQQLPRLLQQFNVQFIKDSLMKKLQAVQNATAHIMTETRTGSLITSVESCVNFTGFWFMNASFTSWQWWSTSACVDWSLHISCWLCVVYRQFGPRTLRTFRNLDLGHFGMSEVSRYLGTGAEVSCRHFGTTLISKTKQTAYPKAYPSLSENNFKFNPSGFYRAALNSGNELQSLVLAMSSCSTGSGWVEITTSHEPYAVKLCQWKHLRM